MCDDMAYWVIVGRLSAFIHTMQHSYPAQQHDIVQSYLLLKITTPYCLSYCFYAGCDLIVSMYQFIGLMYLLVYEYI